MGPPLPLNLSKFVISLSVDSEYRHLHFISLSKISISANPCVDEIFSFALSLLFLSFFLGGQYQAVQIPVFAINKDQLVRQSVVQAFNDLFIEANADLGQYFKLVKWGEGIG